MGKKKLKSINYSIHQFMKTQCNKISISHYHSRLDRLKMMAKELNTMGYELTNISRIKQKHVNSLVNHWKEAGINVGTIKNRLSDLREVCSVYNRNNVMKTNREYNIGNRQYVPSQNKAQHNTDLSIIHDPYIRCSVELQKHFGLRKEECIKIIPSFANKGDKLLLKASWTKGKIERSIPIRTEEQRYWLNRAIEISNNGSLIPNNLSYIKQRNRYDRITRQNNLTNLHGLRHAYAQRRYTELTGWQPPINGGEKQLLYGDKKIDQRARMLIALELGHSRTSVVKIYIG